MPASKRPRLIRKLLLLLTVSFCLITMAASAQPNVAKSRPLVVGYFRGDSMLRQFYVKDLISRGSAPILDQINYSQAHIVDNRCAVADPVADLTYSFAADDSVDGTADTPEIPLRGNFHQLQELKRLYPRLKILISLEGNPDVFVKAAQPENRIAFVNSCVQQFIQGKIPGGINAAGLFDGVDIDWEYPEEADKLDFVALLAEFRRQLNAIGPNFLLSVAMGTARTNYQHLDMAAVALYADQIAIMNYDYAGPWSKRTGLVAPLSFAWRSGNRGRRGLDDLEIQGSWSSRLTNVDGFAFLRLLLESGCAGQSWTVSTGRTGAQRCSLQLRCLHSKQVHGISRSEIDGAVAVRRHYLLDL